MRNAVQRKFKGCMTMLTLLCKIANEYITFFGPVLLVSLACIGFVVFASVFYTLLHKIVNKG